MTTETKPISQMMKEGCVDLPEQPRDALPRRQPEEAIHVRPHLARVPPLLRPGRKQRVAHARAQRAGGAVGVMGLQHA
ncbi:MAG: hypothetical protein ACIAQ0_14830, partial [Phycisphaerales bacterium JB058]